MCFMAAVAKLNTRRTASSNKCMYIYIYTYVETKRRRVGEEHGRVDRYRLAKLGSFLISEDCVGRDRKLWYLRVGDGRAGIEAAHKDVRVVAGLFQQLHLLVDETGRFGAAAARSEIGTAGIQ